MTQRKDVATNPEQAAQDIMIHLLTYRDDIEKHKLQTELDNILELAQKEYSGESMSYFKQYFVYPVSRKRHSELADAIARIKGCSEEQFARFVIIVDLLSKGGACKSTSLNTIILDKLLAATAKYHPITEDKRLDATGALSNDARENVREIVKGLFIAKAKECIDKRIEEKKKEEEQKRLADNERVSVQPGRIDSKMKRDVIDALDAFLKGKIKKIEPNKQEVKKLDRAALAEKHAILTQVFAKHTQSKAALAVEKKSEIKVERLSPLAATREEVVVTPLHMSDRKNELTQVVRRQPGKLAQSEALAASLGVIGGFFAKKFEEKQPQEIDENKIMDEFAAIAMRSAGTKH